MVFYFNCGPEGRFLIYMGRDKYENEELIKYGWPEDVWFHVDKFSSAHVYIRLPEGMTFQTIPEDVVKECATLVKANSIDGSKEKKVDVVYTPWSNLKKTKSMEVGQVSFHSPKQVMKISVEKDNSIVNKINKTKTEVAQPNLKAERDMRDQKEREKWKAEQKKKHLEEERVRAEHKKEAELRSYDRIQKEEDMVSNKMYSNMSAAEYEESFM